MSRRSFLGRIATLIGMGIAAPTVKASPKGLPEPQNFPRVDYSKIKLLPSMPRLIRRIELQRSPVAGFQYHRAEALWPLLAVGAALDLVREPDNVHDPRAVRVDWQGEKIGYVPRMDNAAVSHLLDSGKQVTANIVTLQVADNPWERIEFAVYLTA